MKTGKYMVKASLFILMIAMSELLVGCGNLNLAIRRGDISAVKKYLDKGYDINSPRIYYAPPLMLAIYNCKSEIVDFLLDRGADLNYFKYGSGFTYEYESVDESTLLIFALNRAMGHNMVATHTREEYLGMVNHLIERGADLNACDSSGRTPLIVTLRDADYESAKMLIEKGAQVPSEYGLLVATSYTYIVGDGIGAHPSFYADSLKMMIPDTCEAKILVPGINYIGVYYHLGNRISETAYPLMINVEKGGIYVINFEIDKGVSILRLSDDTWTPWIERFDSNTGKTEKQSYVEEVVP